MAREGSSRKHKSKPSKKERKDKRQKHSSRRRSKRSPSFDSSESDDAQPDFVRDAQSAPVAAEYVRCIVRKYPAMKGELRELLWQIDNEEGVNIDGLRDAKLKGALRGLFTHLHLRHTKQGTYALRTGQDKVLRRIGTVFQERFPDESAQPLRLPGDPTSAAAVPAQPPAASAAAPSKRERSPGAPQLAQRSASPEAPAPRTAGPAAPSEALRRAAAAAAAEMQERGLLGSILADVPAALVGPAPPAAVADADAASADTRQQEVERVMDVLAKSERAGGGAPDAYAVLGSTPEASAAEVRKRFWRVSLLIHPDKCAHAQAAAAFDAVKKAAQALQDSGARAELDARRHAAADAEMDRTVMAELERERQWRVLQGKGTAEDLKGAIKPDEPLRRDGWMTDAPEAPERVPAYMAQKSVTAFSDGASKPVEVDPSWTALPGAAPSNLLKGGHAVVQPQSDKDAIAAKNDELMSLAAREARANAEGAAAPAKSLVEQHRESLQAQRSARKEDKASAAPAGPAAPEKGAAWVPFDRDRDLQAPAAKKSRYQAMLDGDSSLGSRFKKG